MPSRSLSPFWTRFPQRYGTNLAYWYQPKGLAVTVGSVFDRLRVLREFENLQWRDHQSDYVRRLQEEGISSASTDWEDGGAPLARMLKQALTVLGLAWVDLKDKIEITAAGDLLINAKDKEAVLAHQVLKYQFWNPSISSVKHRAVRLHPVPFLVRLLQAVDGSITDREYNLFVSKASKISDVDDVAEEIDRFRELSSDQQSEIVRRCDAYQIGGVRRSSVYNTIKLGRAYAYKMWTLSSLLEEGDDQTLRLRRGSIRGEARRFLDSYAASGVYIDFTTEKEFLSWMGDPSREPSNAVALEIYRSRGDLFAAADIKKRLGASSADVRAFKRMMINERTLEDNIEGNFEDVGRRIGLTLDLVGRQYQTTVGPIDLLGRDRKTGAYVVFELKRDRSADKVFGQLSRYMGWVKKNLAENREVVGVIVGSRIDDSLRSARDAHATKVYLVEYLSQMSVSLV